MSPEKYNVYYFMITLEIYAIKLLLDFSRFETIIVYVNYIIVLNF